MKLKDVKRNYLTDTATQLFLKNSINNVTVKDIAVAASVGEATVYRYFENKTNIVKTSATALQNKVYSEYFVLSGENGYEKISRFYNVYLEIFIHHTDFFKFIYDFDAYIKTEKNVDLSEYSEGLDLFRSAFMKAYNEGIADGSVRQIPNTELFYYTTAHTILSLCKKLAYTDKVVSQDYLFSATDEIKQLINIILYNVKNR